jgi:hypothetical protein
MPTQSRNSCTHIDDIEMHVSDVWTDVKDLNDSGPSRLREELVGRSSLPVSVWVIDGSTRSDDSGDTPYFITPEATARVTTEKAIPVATPYTMWADRSFSRVRGS